MPIKICSEAFFSDLRFFNEPYISDSGPLPEDLLDIIPKKYFIIIVVIANNLLLYKATIM